VLVVMVAILDLLVVVEFLAAVAVVEELMMEGVQVRAAKSDFLGLNLINSKKTRAASNDVLVSKTLRFTVTAESTA
jgi:hypothetical protein